MFPGAHADTTPDKPAIIMGASGQVITYAELDAEANQVSQLFRSLGLRPGDHVAFCLENHPRFFVLAWGAHYAGLCYTAMSSRLTTDEMDYIIDDCGARAFVVSAHKADQAAELSEVLSEGVALPRPVTPLGTPEAVYLAMAALYGATADSVYLSPAPLYHAAPLRFTMAVHRLGATAVVMEHFDAADALALIERHRVTHSQWVPTMFIRMLKLPDDVRRRHDLSSLQVAIHAAAPCPVAVKEQMIEWWGPILHEYYAGTEGNGFVYCNSDDWLAHKGTVGKSLVGEVHIVDEQGAELPPGEPGTIYFGGGAEFAYHNDPEKTAAARDPRGRGWTTLGDVGYLDADGYLYLTDRKAYMIITGGVNVYPQEAENVLAVHPKVADVAVLGVPNDEFGEGVKAGVEPPPIC